MAKIKVSELIRKDGNLSKTDLLLISEFEMADTYTSKSVTGAQIFEGVTTSTSCASFDSTHTQATIIETPTPMAFDETILSVGISLVDGTKMQVDKNGVYNVQFSAQIFRTVGGTEEHVDIWFRVNGSDIPNSNTKMTIANNGQFLVASWNLFVQMSAGDYIEIMWSTTDENIQLLYEEANMIHPAIPSVIATINRIN